MFSLALEEPLAKEDIQIAEIFGGEEDNLPIYLHEDNYRSQDELKSFDIPEADEGIVQPLPTSRSSGITYITGSAGSGKSVFAANYARMYQQLYPKNRVFLITFIPPDGSAIESIPDLIRVDLSLIAKGDLSIKDFADSMVIFDDIDEQPPKPEDPKKYEPKKLFISTATLRDQMLTTSRHYGIIPIVTSHVGCNYRDTRKILNEAEFVVVFPNTGNWFQTNKILQTYCGLDKKTIQSFKALPGRWVMFHRHNPNYVVYEKGVFLTH